MQYKKRILFRTIVGSQMWGMATPESDIDYFTCFTYPTSVFLHGYRPKLSFFTHGEHEDEHMHEIEKVVSQLLSGNINFILGVMSPKVVSSGAEHLWLKDILKRHPPKNVYNSIRGLAMHNYKIYVEKGKDTSEHRLNKILRVLEFGITLLRTGQYKFVPVKGATPELIVKKIKELDEAYQNSYLDYSIPEDVLRDYLYRIRLANLRRELKEEGISLPVSRVVYTRRKLDDKARGKSGLRMWKG